MFRSLLGAPEVVVKFAPVPNGPWMTNPEGLSVTVAVALPNPEAETV